MLLMDIDTAQSLMKPLCPVRQGLVKHDMTYDVQQLEANYVNNVRPSALHRCVFFPWHIQVCPNWRSTVYSVNQLFQPSQSLWDWVFSNMQYSHSVLPMSLQWSRHPCFENMLMLILAYPCATCEWVAQLTFRRFHVHLLYFRLGVCTGRTTLLSAPGNVAAIKGWMVIRPFCSRCLRQPHRTGSGHLASD